jgi:hypothetical protein
LAIGAYMSFSGILTFKSAEAIREAARLCPLDRMLVETDAPYLAPVPHRGKSNEPAFTAHTLAHLAEVKGVSIEDMARITSNNFFRLFSKVPRPGSVRGSRMSLTLTILGCGSSGGVPRIGNNWGQCDPNELKNRRRRCSVLLEKREGDALTRVLVDTTPDLVSQLNSVDAGTLDGVWYTHEHADHTHGIDDLRQVAINMRERVNVWADHSTAEMLLSRFSYCFLTPPGSSYPPILEMNTIICRSGRQHSWSCRCHHRNAVQREPWRH